jgi:hypothetical protein
MGSNVSAGNFLYIIGGNYAGSGTLSVNGCANVTFTNIDSQVPTTGSGGAVLHVKGIVNSTAPCSPVFNTTSSTFLSVAAVEISGSSNTIDQHGLEGFGISSSSPITAPSITTTHNGDFILSGYLDADVNGTIFTASGGGTILIDSGGNFGQAIEGKVQSTAGSIQPAAAISKNSSFGTSVVAIQTASSPSGHCAACDLGMIIHP